MTRMNTAWQPRHSRLVMLLLVLGGMGLAVALTLMGLSENVTFFYAPTALKAEATQLIEQQKNIRIGGMVEKGSVKHSGEKGLEIVFTITDLKETMAVHYTGILPDLFRDGQGVIAEGKLVSIDRFDAHTLLAKHDEKYMPPEIARALEKNGGEKK
jgi:cytochrome c-type biogenesis protein CcmE